MRDLEKIITKTGKLPGKTLTIIGGTHGNEICGVRALDKTISTIEIERGTVHFIYGNPRAIEKNIRETEMNLNRAFRPDSELTEKERATYEYARSRQIMPYLKESIASLDIHSSESIKSIPFIICEPHSFPVAEKLPFSIRSYGWDIIEAGSTDSYMNNQGGQGFCIECGYNLDPEAPERAEKSIYSFLSYFGAISSGAPLRIYPQRTLDAYFIYHTKENFTRSREFADFEMLKKGELIGHDGDRSIIAPENEIIIFCRNRKGPNEEAFILAKEF